MASTQTRPSTYPRTSGPDYRVRATERSYEDYFASVTPGDLTDRPALVEVQAYCPARADGGTAPLPVVSLGIHGPHGLADIMLSPDEAREVGLALLSAMADARSLPRRPFYASAEENEVAAVTAS